MCLVIFVRKAKIWLAFLIQRHSRQGKSAKIVPSGLYSAYIVDFV